MQDSQKIKEFKKAIWNYYKKNKRAMPWRETTDPYCIVVSEIMLQQTQVKRVLKKYPLFIKTFPDFQSLAKASLSHVLKIWQGMGYNRRAIALKKIAEKVMHEYNGVLPQAPEVLITFPGIGKATAGSIMAFAFNAPSIFIETNIRRVFIHHFFANKKNIKDEDILEYVKDTVDKKLPREWYLALMDYGTHLGEILRAKNPNTKSKVYKKQSKFEGSDRKIRGVILRILINEGKKTKEEIVLQINEDHVRVEKILSSLVIEGFLIQNNNRYQLKP
ncbi:MAG: A/G-specific adenine glycosylase [Parcubacteria group bacterium]|nr:A/G-specific adenine glycosylase [Parcubacteria group bacterium]